MAHAVLLVLALSCDLVFGGPLSPARNTDYGRLPLAFEENRGQTDRNVRFLARAGGHSIFITGDKAMLALRDGEDSAAVSIQLSKTRRSAEQRAESPLAGYSNYYIGNDPSKWVQGVPNFGRIRVAGIRRGIDLVYYGTQGQFEYDLDIAAGADASDLVLHIEGAQSLRVDGAGDLLIHTAAGDLRQRAPVAWQEVGGRKRPVTVRHVLRGGRDVLLRVGRYHRNHPLTIDPVVSYSTNLGGSGGELVSSIAVDGFGYAYVTGYTSSADFAVTSGSYHGSEDAYVAKINPAGTALVYATYVGGSQADYANAIALDGSGNAFITGWTYSSDFPIAFGGTSSYVASKDAFVARINSSGVIAASRYLAGSGSIGSGIAVDPNGDAYVAGSTASSAFPTTAGSLMTTKPTGSSTTGFVVKMDSSLNIIYGTYLGGGGTDLPAGIAVSSIGQVYVVGSTTSANFPTSNGVYQSTYKGAGDAFVTELNAQGSAVVYSTFLGGSSSDQATAIALGGAGTAYVTGLTESMDFPTTAGAFSTSKPNSSSNENVFVTKLNAGGATLGYSTYLGGTTYFNDLSTGIVVDSSERAYVLGTTSATNFPTTPGSLKSQQSNQFFSGQDLFLTEFNPTGTSVVYSTFFGTASDETAGGVALDGNGGVYITGRTNSPTFPTTATALQPSSKESQGNYSGFVTKIDFSSSVLCNIVLSSNSVSLSGRGGTGSFTFTVASGCPWEITSDSFITVGAPHGGFGNGTVNYTVAQNQSTYFGETGTITVNGGVLTAGTNILTVNQAAGSCTDPVFGSSSVNFDGTGGIHDVSVTLPSNCAWNLSNPLPWISLSNSVNSAGTGTLAVFAAPNAYSQRQGTVTLATKSISIVQTGGSCTLSLASHQTSVPAQITAGSVSFTTGGSCTWTAYSTVPWIQINPNSSSGQGNGSVPFVVAGNPGTAARTGSLLIGDQTYQVMQAGGPGVTPTTYTQSGYTGPYCCGPLGDGGPVGNATVFDPSEMAFDGTGNMYIADTINGRIRRVDTNGIITTFAGGGSSGLGDGGPPTSAMLSQPQGVAVDSLGNVYIADTGNQRIRKVSANVISTIAGTGLQGFNGDHQPATSAQISAPTGIVIDGAGNVYFSDTGNQRIRRITPGGTISTVAGTGTQGYGGDGGSATAALLNYPSSLALDSAGNLYFIEFVELSCAQNLHDGRDHNGRRQRDCGTLRRRRTSYFGECVSYWLRLRHCSGWIGIGLYRRMGRRYTKGHARRHYSHNFDERQRLQHSRPCGRSFRERLRR
jgi:hypothetical protein